MTRAEAHALLDAARAGEDIPAWRITRALRVTGDVDADEQAVSWVPAGRWALPAGLAPAGPFDALGVPP